ncbi:hypothetical protein A0H81_10560 [Grifola frondosa]|uniref:Uncharacterized protein n=1 Tax=Grifola frondosa TaxID=5627 RepID=A0A1C7M3W0_GRIFR|nr:hypothetical protein A0H81_10560 [Grifola frondosa]
MPPREAQTTIRPLTSLAPIHPAPQSAYDIKNDKTKSNGAAVSNANSPSSTGVTTSDVQAVSEFLSTMKMTLGALGATFDALGDQTARIAALGPAISATHQVCASPQ